MTTGTRQIFRKPKTTNEKRHNAGFARIDGESGETVKGPLRGSKTGSRLAAVRDDVFPASRRDRSRGKPTWSAARNARALRLGQS